MYSGGKDSTNAIEYCLAKNWEITHLISVKPSITDCYLFHFATVELTKEIAEILGIKHIYLTCNVADPLKEGKIVEEAIINILKETKIDALVLGGVGLQETQIKTLQKLMMPHKVEVFATHSGEEQEVVLKEMLNKGYRFIITSIASDGLQKWLGIEITLNNFSNLKHDSIKYGFDLLGEGGYYDSFAFDAPFLSKKLIIEEFTKVQEGNYNGHIVVNKFKIVLKNKAEV